MTPTTKAGQAMDVLYHRLYCNRVETCDCGLLDAIIQTEREAAAEAEALRAGLERLATKWDAEARLLLIVRSMLQNTEGWTLERCATELRAALATPAPAAPAEPER